MLEPDFDLKSVDLTIAPNAPRTSLCSHRRSLPGVRPGPGAKFLVITGGKHRLPRDPGRQASKAG